jgi:hypothetical protein
MLSALGRFKEWSDFVTVTEVKSLEIVVISTTKKCTCVIGAGA